MIGAMIDAFLAPFQLAAIVAAFLAGCFALYVVLSALPMIGVALRDWINRR